MIGRATGFGVQGFGVRVLELRVSERTVWCRV